MATKKPTAKQLAARKKFAQMAKDGTLKRKRAAATKKKKGLRFPGRCDACRNGETGGVYIPSAGTNCNFANGDRCISLPIATRPKSTLATASSSLGKPNAKKATTTAKAPAKRKKTVSAKSLCRKVIKVPGINSRTGQLLKGWKYVNGKPKKVVQKPAAKKKAPAKKK